MKFICSCCGKELEEWPSLAYNAPANYYGLSEDEKRNLASLDDDFCTIRHSGLTDRFIRATLTQKVLDCCQNLDYGVWVSLSEKSFEDYIGNFTGDDHEAIYFGWLSNNLPDYEFKGSIPTSVFTRKCGQRPEIVPHEGHDHPFVRDYYNGITKEEAERRINNILESK